MNSLPNSSKISSSYDNERLADFILLSQRSCILNLSSKLAAGKVSYAQFFLLTYLAKEDFLSMSDIANKMGHSTAAATGMVDRLEKLKLVKRVHAADDRRRIMVEITRKGVRLVNEMRQHIASDLASIMAQLDEEETETLRYTHHTIKKN